MKQIKTCGLCNSKLLIWQGYNKGFICCGCGALLKNCKNNKSGILKEQVIKAHHKPRINLECGLKKY